MCRQPGNTDALHCTLHGCLQKPLKYSSFQVAVWSAQMHTSPYRCARLPVGVLCHETVRPRCWRMPGKWGWPAGGHPYGMGASCPGRSPWMSRTARFGGTTGPEVKTIKTRSCEVTGFHSVSLSGLFITSKETNNIIPPLIFSIPS